MVANIPSSLGPAWIYGDGSDGDVTLHNGDTLKSGSYRNLTIETGATVTATLVTDNVAPAVVCCTGIFTVDGTVDLSGRSSVNRNGWPGNTSIGETGVGDPSTAYPAAFVSGAGGTGVSGAGGLASVFDATVRQVVPLLSGRLYGGRGGGSGAGDGTNYGGAAGEPGNYFIVCAAQIVLGGSHAFLLQGGDGAPGGDNGTGSTGHGDCGGGGGGAGGWWLAIYDLWGDVAPNETGTGGAGGSGCGSGTAGGPGETGHGIYLVRAPH